eukprot:TRINITY_DN4061_c0_g1_i9.p1 TRINITY_DN4061_c0_g1~~TRINITY_DN4061_c0_g1_i9.p1  ORF type:complete len:117 (-),score=19.26 TRINITY_DN4061_c0_g1_i9:983-1333(-)
MQTGWNITFTKRAKRIYFDVLSDDELDTTGFLRSLWTDPNTVFLDKLDADGKNRHCIGSFDLVQIMLSSHFAIGHKTCVQVAQKMVEDELLIPLTGVIELSVHNPSIFSNHKPNLI